MENELPQLSKRSIVAVLLIIPVACLLALITTSIIIPGSQWPPEPPAIVAAIVGPVVLVGFLIYGSNLKDERTSQIGDKATRNGFMFIIYALPLSLVILSLTGASIETVMALLIMCLGMIAITSISAVYYYYK